jgi:membrane fusion protein (multidrug efflux system)
MKRLLALFTLLGMALVMGAGCHSSEADPATPPHQQHVLVGQPQVGTIENTITLPGDIVGYYQSTLYAKVTGYLKSISVDKGDWVKAGQILAVIEVPELQQRLDRSQANLQIARLTYQRMENVWRSDPRLVARQDVDISLAKYQEAKAEDDELHAFFSYTRITAPFDGMITARYVDPGALIHAGGHQNGMSQAERTGDAARPVVSLARLDKLRIYVYLPQNEVDFVHIGLPVTVAVQGETARYRGAVARFAHSLDLSTRTMLTEVDLENPNPNALRLPQSAVGGTKSHRVFIVRNSQLSKIPVQTGISDGRNVEIVSGVTRKDLVVQDFSASLQSGEQVNYSVVHDASEVASAREADPNASTITR